MTISPSPTLTPQQVVALSNLCARYGVRFDPANFGHPFDLPVGWVCGVVGPITVGCSPQGDIAS